LAQAIGAGFGGPGAWPAIPVPSLVTTASGSAAGRTGGIASVARMAWSGLLSNPAGVAATAGSTLLSGVPVFPMPGG
jgi:hypothetical protein